MRRGIRRLLLPLSLVRLTPLATKAPITLR